MAEEFDPDPHVYLAVTVPKFPNYFVINGVRGKFQDRQSVYTPAKKTKRELGSRLRLTYGMALSTRYFEILF
jgi:hypothetical protein